FACRIIDDRRLVLAPRNLLQVPVDNLGFPAPDVAEYHSALGLFRSLHTELVRRLLLSQRPPPEPFHSSLRPECFDDQYQTGGLFMISFISPRLPQAAPAHACASLIFPFDQSIGAYDEASASDERDQRDNPRRRQQIQ